MAKKKSKTNTKATVKLKRPSFKLSSQQKLVFGSFLLILGILLCISFFSFLFHWKSDQSTLSQFTSRTVEVNIWLYILGFWVINWFILVVFSVIFFVFIVLIFI